MSGKPNDDRKTIRRQATIDEIVASAWELSKAKGLSGFSMRELGDQVGMRAQSIYSYFESKNEIYDAMFLDGNRAFVEAMPPAFDPEPATDGSVTRDQMAAAARRFAHHFFEFCTSDPVRYQLLFQRTIPDFVPSEESMAVAGEAYEKGLAPLTRIGLMGDDLDLCTAVLAGLVSQQLANDPGGDRWERLVDSAVDMLLAELAPDLFDRSIRSAQ